MILTFFGLLIAAIGMVLLFRGGVMDMMLLMMACSLFGGSAAVVLTALGGSSIPPAHFALVLCLMRIFLPGSQRLRQLGEAVRTNLFLALYCLYAVAAALLAPILFRGEIRIPPLRVTGRQVTLFDTAPLQPSPQNVTASVYIMGSLCAGLVAFTAMREPGSARRFVNAGIVIACVHMTVGVVAALLHGTAFDEVIDLIRNANYNQTHQTLYGWVRLTGVFPEPSAYASFAFGWFVFLFECWIRDVQPRRTGPVALALALLLVASTSSTAYVALGAYTAIFCLRSMAFPQFIDARKGLALAIAALLVVTMVSLGILFVPALLNGFGGFLVEATVQKQHSESGLQRAFWAKSGYDAFVQSYGIGIGPGSFRSSSFVTAVLGSVGAFGASTFVAHLVRAFKPINLSTYCDPVRGRRFGEEAMIGVAAAWAAVGILIPGSIASPTCDPGLDFATFTAVALALRSRPATAPIAPGWAAAHRYGAVTAAGA